MNRLSNPSASKKIRPVSIAYRCWLAILFATAISTGVTRADIIIDGYTDATNDRFTNHSSFIMSGFNLSGVGLQQSASHGPPPQGAWVTALSRNVVISAAHAPASPTVNFVFYANNDPSSTPVIRTVISGTQIPGTDMYLSVLDSNLPDTIVHYDYATEFISGPTGNLVTAGPYQNMNTYMFGRSPLVRPDNLSFQDQAVGRNRISGFVENINFNGLPDCDALILFYDGSGSPNYVQHEAQLQGGDSGAPLFVEIGGQLRLLGINSFNGSQPQTLSGVSYMGNHAAFINNFINAVPEPSAATLLMMGSIAIAIRRRRAD